MITALLDLAVAGTDTFTGPANGPAGKRAYGGHLAAQALAAFVQEMKASGFVDEALARHGIQGASVAPL